MTTRLILDRESLLVHLLTGADELAGFFGAGAAKDFEEFVFGLVVTDEEVFDLLHHVSLQIGNRLVMVQRWHLIGDGNEPVVAQHAALFALGRFDDAEHAGGNKAPRKGGFFHEHKNVERTIVLGPGARDETKMEGKHGTSGENFLQAKEPEFFIVGKFVSRSLWCFNYGIQQPVQGVEGVKMEEIGHGVGKV